MYILSKNYVILGLQSIVQYSYVWHVHCAKLNNVGNKSQGRENQIRIFHALGEIMHTCEDDESVKKEVEILFEGFSDHTKFLEYFKTTWLSNKKICKFLISVSFHDSILHAICIVINL